MVAVGDFYVENREKSYSRNNFFSTPFVWIFPQSSTEIVDENLPLTYPQGFFPHSTTLVEKVTVTDKS